MLDSGAYTAWRKGSVIDIDEYIAFIKNHQDTFDEVINLDVIMDAKQSYKNWIYMRRQGVNAIPVYHFGTDEIWLKRYLDQTDYICIGAIANVNPKQRLLGLSRIWQKYFIDPKTKLAKYKIHGLGITAAHAILRYPWYSVDSVSPHISAAYGGMYLPALKKNEADFSKLTSYLISNQSRKHKVGNTKSIASRFTNIEEAKMITNFIQSYGFEIGNMHNVVLTPSRKDKKKTHTSEQPKMFTSPPAEQGDTPTLANNWEVRAKWNTIMWKELMMRMPDITVPWPAFNPKVGGGVPIKNRCIVYIGIGSSTHLQLINSVDPNLPVLISYEYLRSKKATDDSALMKIIKNRKQLNA